VVYAYAGTIEVEIGHIVSQKLRCLSSVVKMHEDWQDVIMKGSDSTARARTVKELLASTENIKSDEAGELIDESTEEDEE
jgi:hypothetical protein